HMIRLARTVDGACYAPLAYRPASPLDSASQLGGAMVRVQRAKRRAVAVPRRPALTFVRELLRVVAAREPRDKLLTSVMQGAAHLCAADVVAVTFRRDPATLEVVGVYGAPGAVHDTVVPIDGTVNGGVATTGRTFRCTDTRRLPGSARGDLLRRNDVR